MISRLLITSVIVAAALFSIPVTGESFTATGDMTATRKSHSTTLLPNGKALVTGGEGGDITASYTIPQAAHSAQQGI